MNDFTKTDRGKQLSSFANIKTRRLNETDTVHVSYLAVNHLSSLHKLSVCPSICLYVTMYFYVYARVCIIYAYACSVCVCACKRERERERARSRARLSHLAGYIPSVLL